MATGTAMADKTKSARISQEAMEWAKKAQPWSEHETLEAFLSAAVLEHSKALLRALAPQLVPDEKPKRSK